MNKIDDLLTRGVEEVLPSKARLAKLMKEKRITLYQGFDPSMPSLHLGNLVGVMKLRQFQKLGHKVIFLVGDFTGMIGDPTDKLAVRKQLTREKVLENAKNWKNQIKNLLTFDGDNPVEIKFNSEWNDKISFKDLIDITSNFTVQQMIERDMFQARIKVGKPIFLHEFLYPVAQGYDFVAMDVDLEIGGNDQLFNMMAGRSLMKAMKGKEGYVLATKLLVDKEGNKVGKTSGNALFLSSGPEEFYGGIMSIPDQVIELAFELLTEEKPEGLSEKIRQNPFLQKKRLAIEIVRLVWGKMEAQKAQENFDKVFSQRELPSSIPEHFLPSKKLPLLELISSTQLVKSNSEAKRLIKQGAIVVSGKTINNPRQEIDITDWVHLKIGKRKFAKVKYSQ
ncbi:tyrosine--tRNA ligase [Candidatus Woesebacteria bacterium RIFCSPLOWO2_01_FULL_39_21]|uniref:Tyrosine--tRNA ligase n=1 Tax=Candidatus Woesebacteria bacterium RIFCSPLOWO2_01_FULL_39_21 TaxID=1802519 RepID=A0A1F8BKC1_9BACT|nr:MAG: tyrosine--tRNA ligase [Candidatus Woesebacteria bacterium RIFCSPHIGHO2_01_FULL_39_23]OGM64472.1 MAG: tyrosine--tRNA ligase [Candidatus Woesebacteria bacterium RIFCSPLOWO2_01_FULL_39_21]